MKKVAKVIVQWAFCGVLIVSIWQWLVVPHTSQVFIPSPLSAWRMLTTLISNGTVLDATRTTLSEAATGFLLGLAIGILVALAIGLLPSIVGNLAEPVVAGIFAAPIFVLGPILFVWLGPNFVSRVVFVTVGVFPVFTIYTVVGIRTVNRDLVRMMELMGATRRQIVRKIVLPHTRSQIVTAVTWVAPHAIALAIGAEILFGTTTGIGGALNTDSTSFNAAGVFAVLAVGTAVSALCISLAKMVGRRLSM